MQTPLQITFRGMETSPFFESLIRQRAVALERFHSRITGCRVVVDIPHASAESAKVPIEVIVEVSVPHHNIILGRGKADRREMKDDQSSAINRAFEGVERQLTRISQLQSRANPDMHAANGEAGVVVGLFPDQSYGFIEVKGSSDLYFTRNAVTGGSFDDLTLGTFVIVTRAATEGPMGPQASSVRPQGARSPE